jgi:GGDEF domain-containing protein
MLSDSVVETLYRLAPRNGDRVLGFTSDVRARQRMKRLCEQAGVPYRGVQALRLASRGGSGAADKAFPVDREPAGQPLEVVTDYRRLQEELIRVSAEAGRTGSSFGLLTISINHLPPVEDEGSRRLNREVLQACAARIARLRRRYDVVAHCSSRTFCVVLKNLESGADLSSIAQRFSQALHSDPVTVDGRPYRVSAHMDTGIGPDAATALIGRDSRSPALDAVGPALGKK